MKLAFQRPQISIPRELPAPEDVEQCVESLAYRHCAWPTLSSSPGFSGFWKHIRDCAFFLQTREGRFTILFHTIAFENPEIPIPAELPISWLAETVPEINSMNAHVGYTWITGAELLSSRLYDYRQLLRTYACRKPQRFSLAMPVTPDPLPFTEAVPTRFVPIIFKSERRDPRGVCNEMNSAYGQESIIESIESELNVRLFQGREVCKVDLAFSPPNDCIRALMISLRLQKLAASFCGNRFKDVTAWDIVGVFPMHLLLSISLDEKMDILSVPFSAFWECLEDVRGEIGQLFSERLPGEN